MKKEILFILIVLSTMAMLSCTNEELTVKDGSLEDNIIIEEDLVESGAKTEQVPEGYRLKENVYHNMEFLEDKIYARYQWINPNDENDWTNALWCFSPYEDIKLIAEGKGLDFRVSRNTNFIAIEINGNIDFYNKEGEIVHTISSEVINTEERTTVQLEQWNDEGDILWCTLMKTYNTVAYISIDTKTWEIIKYNDRNFYSHEYILNPNTGWIVYSDYPVMMDNIAAGEYYESKQLTTLFLYNLLTKQELEIETFETNSFRPKWSNDDAVLYYIGDRVHFYKFGDE